MMIEVTNKIIKEIEKIEQTMTKTFGEIENITNMDDDSLLMYKSCFKMINLSKDLMYKQATEIDYLHHTVENIDQKLDKVIKLLENRA